MPKKLAEFILTQDKTTKGTSRFSDWSSEVCTAIYIKKPYMTNVKKIKVTVEEVTDEESNDTGSS